MTGFETSLIYGTKQGCGEGDCGACTVSIARPDAKGNLVYRPVNACILFMGMVNGAAIRTVEGLATSGNQLHPVQAAMVKMTHRNADFARLAL